MILNCLFRSLFVFFFAVVQRLDFQHHVGRFHPKTQINLKMMVTSREHANADKVKIGLWRYREIYCIYPPWCASGTTWRHHKETTHILTSLLETNNYTVTKTLHPAA